MSNNSAAFPRLRRDVVALTLPLTVTGATWLLVLHNAQGYRERGNPGLLVQGLHGFAVALPLVALAIAVGLLVVQSLVAPGAVVADGAPPGRAVTVATVGFAGAAALAVAAAVQAWLFGGADALQIPLALHVVRDALIALAVAAPVCAAIEVLRSRIRPADRHETVPGAGEHTTSRRAFLGYGMVAAAGGAAFASGRFLASPASAAGTVTVDLFINEGYVRMVDGTPAFMRSFGLRTNNGFGKPGPRIPGPAIGPAGDPPIGTVAFVTEGDSVTVRIKNGLTDVHSFAIQDVVDPVQIAAGATAVVTFTAPSAGTYFYQDVLPAQSLLGLHGVMVVMPAGITNRPYGPNRTDLPVAPTFQFQYVWVLADVDPVWGELARLRKPIDVSTFLPRYFLINGVSGEESTLNPRTVPDRRLGESSLIRIVNMGAATHSPHFHGNHVYVLSRNRGGFRFQDPNFPNDPSRTVVIAQEKDVIRMDPDSVTDVLLPVHVPNDQFPPYDPSTAPTNLYPMHCHAEMSQTAGGGSYPSGMLTDWILRTDRPPLKAV
jgi:Multicopper oxidase